MFIMKVRTAAQLTNKILISKFYLLIHHDFYTAPLKALQTEHSHNENK